MHNTEPSTLCYICMLFQGSKDTVNDGVYCRQPASVPTGYIFLIIHTYRGSLAEDGKILGLAPIRRPYNQPGPT